jgi:hypothetical protein
VKAQIDGFILEFATEACQSFYRAEEELKKGAQGRLLKEIPLFLKMLLVEAGMLAFIPVSMAA